MFTGSLAEPKGGAYARSRLSRSKTVILPAIAVENIDALIDAIFTHDLRAQQAACSFFGNDLDARSVLSRIVAGVVVVARHAGKETEARLGGLRAGQARCSCCHMQDAHDRGAQRAGIPEISARGVRARDAALAVGRPGQRNTRARAGKLCVVSAASPTA